MWYGRMDLRKFETGFAYQSDQNLSECQTYPIDTAKTQYQRNCMTKTWGQAVERPRIDYFHFVQYRGKYSVYNPNL